MIAPHYASQSKSKGGFTIVELLIATAVFSAVLLISLIGFLQIGKLFYKGIAITQTGNVAHQALNSIKNDIAFDTELTPSFTMPQNHTISVSPFGTINRYWFCIGGSRYAYTTPARQLDLANEATNMSGPAAGWYKFSLLKDSLSASGCPDPFSNAATAMQASTTTEILADKMRLSSLTISQLPAPNNKLYTVNIKVAYGDDSTLQNPTQPTAVCDSNPSNAQYCFISTLRTTARRGL